MTRLSARDRGASRVGRPVRRRSRDRLGGESLPAWGLLAALGWPMLAQAQDIGPLVLIVALPGVLLGVAGSVWFKVLLLSRPRYRASRPRLRRFLGLGLADFAVWALLLPAVLALRIGGQWVYREHMLLAIVAAFACGYLLNYFAFRRTLMQAGTGLSAGVALSASFTIAMPALVFIAGSTIFVIASLLQQ
jgi:hypothetical protein